MNLSLVNRCLSQQPVAFSLTNLSLSHTDEPVSLSGEPVSLSVACLTFQRSEHFLENSAKLTDCSGFFFRCSSRHVWTKNAYADVLPLGLLWSLRIIFLPVNTGAYYIIVLPATGPLTRSMWDQAMEEMQHHSVEQNSEKSCILA